MHHAGCVCPSGLWTQREHTDATGWDAVAQALRRGAENERLRGELHLQRTEKSEIFRHGSLVARAVRGIRFRPLDPRCFKPCSVTRAARC
jgi:hypothetical protein